MSSNALKLISTHNDFVPWSRFHVEGGTILFKNQHNDIPLRFIETTFCDISVFASPPYYNASIFLEVKFNYISQKLWTQTTDTTYVGYTLEKTIYDLGEEVYVSDVVLTSSGNNTNIYYMLWKENPYIILSKTPRPNFTLNSYTLNYSYTVIPGNFPMHLPIYATLNIPQGIYVYIVAYVSSTPIDIQYIGTPQINAIDDFIVFPVQLILTNAIYNLNKEIFIIITNDEGLSAQQSLVVNIMSLPDIYNPGVVTSNISPTSIFQYEFYITNSNTTGPVTWSIDSYTLDSNINIDSNGILTIPSNLQVNNTVYVSASNSIYDYSSIAVLFDITRQTMTTVLENVYVSSLSSNAVTFGLVGNNIDHLTIQIEYKFNNSDTTYVNSNTLYNQSNINNMVTINNMLPNITHRFTFTPYDTLNNIGNDVSLSNVITLASEIQDLEIININPINAYLVWTNGNYEYATVTIQRSLPDFTSVFLYTSNIGKTNNYFITNLYPDEQYSYTVTSYNYNNISTIPSGNSFRTPITSSILNITNITPTSAVIYWNSYIYPVRNFILSYNGSFYGNYFVGANNPYTINNLIPYTVFDIVAYNIRNEQIIDERFQTLRA